MKLPLSLFFLLSTSLVFAHEEAIQEPSPSEFHLEKNLLDQLYQSTLNQSEVNSAPGGLDMGVHLSMLSPSNLSLTNSYFQVPLGQTTQSLPMAVLELGQSLARSGGWELGWSARVGYSFREGVQSVLPKAGGLPSKDFIRLHWVSAFASLRGSYDLPFAGWIRPALSAGAGGHWIYQSGRLDGISQSFWIPSFLLSADVTLFDQTQYGEHWFAGLVLGTSYMQQFASEQKVALWAMDVGVRFAF